MKKIPLAVFVAMGLSNCSTSDEFDWLQGKWISDKEATLLENSKGENLTKGFGSVFWDGYGGLTWHVSNDTVTTTDSDGTEYAYHFEIEWRDPGSREAIIYLLHNGSSYLSSYLWQTDTGFCTKSRASEFAVTEYMRNLYPEDHPIVASDTYISKSERDAPFVVADCYKPAESSNDAPHPSIP